MAGFSGDRPDHHRFCASWIAVGAEQMGKMGLLGMQERVSLVGGEFAIESLPGGGTEVRAGFAVGEKAPSKS